MKFDDNYIVLSTEFEKSRDYKKLMNKKNGALYFALWLKLCYCAKETNGKLIFYKDGKKTPCRIKDIPKLNGIGKDYTIKMISEAIKIFVDLNMAEINNGIITLLNRWNVFDDFDELQSLKKQLDETKRRGKC